MLVSPNSSSATNGRTRTHTEEQWAVVNVMDNALSWQCLYRSYSGLPSAGASHTPTLALRPLCSGPAHNNGKPHLR